MKAARLVKRFVIIFLYPHEPIGPLTTDHHVLLFHREFHAVDFVKIKHPGQPFIVLSCYVPELEANIHTYKPVAIL